MQGRSGNGHGWANETKHHDPVSDLQAAAGIGVRFCPHDGTPLSETAATQNVKTPTAGPAARHPPAAVVGGRYRLEEVRGAAVWPRSTGPPT